MMDKKTVEHIESLIGENASLRALLAEARKELSQHVFTQESPACANCGGELSLDVEDSCPYQAELTERIDAALAEPTHNKGKA